MRTGTTDYIDEGSFYINYTGKSKCRHRDVMNMGSQTDLDWQWANYIIPVHLYFLMGT